MGAEVYRQGRKAGDRRRSSWERGSNEIYENVTRIPDTSCVKLKIKLRTHVSDLKSI